MKDIEDMLSKHSPHPNREAHNNFTATVIAEIKSRQHATIKEKFMNFISSRLWTKTAAISMAGLFVVGGTVAAIVLWPKPSVTPIVTKQLPSGNHIVGYDTQNCNYFDELNGGKIVPTHEVIYYEVRQSSSLTDQQLKNALQGECEENVSNAAMTHLIKADLANKNLEGASSTEAYIINSITNKSITVSQDSHYNASLYTTLPHQTYARFAGDLVVYNQASKISYSDLHVGDTVKMMIQDTTKQSSETSANYNPLNHPENVVILAILKIPALTQDPSAFYTLVGSDIVRVETCKTSSTGFCRAYEFVK